MCPAPESYLDINLAKEKNIFFCEDNTKNLPLAGFAYRKYLTIVRHSVVINSRAQIIMTP